MRNCRSKKFDWRLRSKPNINFGSFINTTEVLFNLFLDSHKLSMHMTLPLYLKIMRPLVNEVCLSFRITDFIGFSILEVFTPNKALDTLRVWINFLWYPINAWWSKGTNKSYGLWIQSIIKVESYRAENKPQTCRLLWLRKRNLGLRIIDSTL